MSTPSNGIPYVPENTLDPAAGLNLSLDVIDALLQTFVVDMDRTAPPSSPADGQMHIVATGATGAWAGQANNLARYVAEAAAWQFYSAGLQVRYVLNLKDSGLYVWLSGAWRLLARNPTVEPGYIDGLRMVRNSGTSLSVTSGTAYIPSAGANVNNPALITKSALSLTPSTIHHVYLFLNSGVPDIEVVTTAPASPYNGVARAKTGDTSRRYIGSVLTDGTGAIYNFLHNNNDIVYRTDAGVTPFRVLSGGAATTATAVSCASAVPTTSRVIQGTVTNGTNVGLRILESLGTYGAAGRIFGLAAGGFGSLPIPLNLSQEFQYYLNSAPTGAVTIEVTGYNYER